MQPYPSYLYRDPLLLPQYLSANRRSTPIQLTNVIDLNVDGDFLLEAYITRLSEEIANDMPEGLNPLAEAFWKDDKWCDLTEKIYKESRTHGWCVVQLLDNGEFEVPWRVLSVVEFQEYIMSEPDKDGYKTLIGMKFAWSDYLGNQYKEELKFEDPNVHLIKYREGKGETFAFPDLSQALLTLVFEIRQIRGQMTFSASKASFKHFVYGDAVNDPKAAILDQKIQLVDSTNGIGASEQLLKEIRNIENHDITIIMPALLQQIRFFASATRLPLSYYLSEKETGGMSDVGEKMDELRVQRKKENIFNHYKKHIIIMFQKFYSITLNDISLKKSITLEELETNGQDDQGNNQNEQSDRRESEDSD